MPWHDPARETESAEDRELRDELRQLLGAPEPFRLEAELTPSMVALAEELRKEALRRRRTIRSRPGWILLAAAVLPFAMVLVGVGAWGVQQKRRADQLAVAAQQREAELQRAAKATSEAAPKPDHPLILASKEHSGRRAVPASRGGELVIPAEKAAPAASLDTQRVKAQ